MRPRRRDLLVALGRREINGRLAMLCAAAAALAVYAGVLARDLRAGADMLLFDRMILSFDYTALGIMVFMTSLRVAVRTADDHRAAWLDAWLAQGGDRAVYMPAAALTAAAAGLAVTAAAAGAYGLSLLYLDGSTEIIRRLPRLLGGGALLLAAHALLAGIIGMVLRHAPATIGAAGALTIVPVIVMAAWASANPTAEPSVWINAISVAAPPLQPPDRFRIYVLVGVWSAALLALSIPAAHRYVGRRP